MARHRAKRITVSIDHDGRVRLSMCDECVDPTEAVRLLRTVANHLTPMAHPEG